MPKIPEYATAGSKRWLQVAVAESPALLDTAFQRAGALDADERLGWCSPIAATQFVEHRDERALQVLGISELPVKPLVTFWPRRGPVWDGLAVTTKGNFVFVEAKAHIPELLSPPSKAGDSSRKLIIAALDEARKHYAPKSTKLWFEYFYQYCNRLAHQYFFLEVNHLPSRLVFLNFFNAPDVASPTSPDEWNGAIRLVHAFLGLPESLEENGVYHINIDVRAVQGAG